MAELPAKPTVPDATIQLCPDPVLINAIQSTWAAWVAARQRDDINLEGVLTAKLTHLTNLLDREPNSVCFSPAQWKLMNRRWAILDGAYNQIREFYLEQKKTCDTTR